MASVVVGATYLAHRFAVTRKEKRSFAQPLWTGQDLQGKLSSQTLAKQQSNPSNLIGSTDYLA